MTKVKNRMKSLDFSEKCNVNV